jgi:hypothetical protein
MTATSAERFEPNKLSFEQGLQRIKEAVEKVGLKRGTVVTSRDLAAEKLRELLVVNNVPPGFQKWQLPVYLNKPSQLFITVAQPGVEAPSHSHDEGDGVRFIVSGSIIHDGRELTAGDWMFIPARAQYSFRVGRFGAVMCYCYCCCCA